MTDPMVAGELLPKRPAFGSAGSVSSQLETEQSVAFLSLRGTWFLALHSAGYVIAMVDSSN